MKLEHKLKLLLILMIILTVSCIQQDKNIVHSDFVVIKDADSEKNLSRSNLLYKSMKKIFEKSNIRLDYLDINSSFSFEDEMQRQIKDFGRKFIFILTDYPEDKLVQIATQNPKINFIVLRNIPVDTSIHNKLQNIKYITFDNQKIIKQLAYIAAYWVESKEGEQGKIAFLYDERSFYYQYQNAFMSGVREFNNDYQRNISIINVNLENQYQAQAMDNLFDKLIKQNSVVYFIASDKEYFTILKKIQTIRQYSIGLETDLFYNKPEFQDIILISENTDYELIGTTILDAVNSGQIQNLDISISPEKQLVKLSPFHNFDTGISNDVKNKLRVSLFQ
ncbi:MAG TPA: hypothetical protein PK816_05890 [Candidatus Cloacimonadota bacterium]|nr:hypothetical protein [Candidatus Cloacimonadota bacterium]